MMGCFLGPFRRLVLTFTVSSLVLLLLFVLGDVAYPSGSRGGKSKLTEEILKLPAPKTKGKMSVEEAIRLRRSVRSFASKDLPLEDISQLLWVSYGQRDIDAFTGASRTVPSAGALYPMEIYLVSTKGVFHYVPEKHSLEKLSDGDLRRALSRSALWQEAIASAPVTFVIACVYERICRKYGERGVRYAHMEAGHIAQNIHLQAVSLGLGSVPIGAFDDGSVQKVLSLPRDNIPLYIIPVGYPE